MLKAKKNIFFSKYNIFKNADYFGTLKASSLRPYAEFIAQSGIYTFHREHWFSGSYFCRLENSYIAKADKPNGIGLSYEVRHRSDLYFMKPGNHFHENLELNYEIFKADEHIGSIYQNPTRFFLNIDIDQLIPEIIQCFIFWLAYRAWVGKLGWSRARIARFRPGI